MSIERLFETGERMQDRSHFRNMVLIARADGVISEQEVALLQTPLLETNTIDFSVLEQIEKMVNQFPNAVALQYKNEILTYRGLNKRANQLANYLKSNGINSGDKIALYNYRNTDYIVSVLAVMKLGGVFIPIASNQPNERISFILSNSNASIVLTNPELKNNLKAIEIPIVDILSHIDSIEKEPSDNLNAKQDLNSLAYILYTSGSTGNPKGVLISNKALSNYIFWGKNYYEFSNKSSFALFTSIGFDLTITSTFLPLVSGGRIIVYKENISGPDSSILDVIKDNLVDTIKLTPSHLAFFKDKDLTNSAIEKIIVGGEDFKVNLGKSIKLSFGNRVRIFNEYGPTEATVGCIVSEFDIEKHLDSSIPIGDSIKNMHAYILDSHKNIVPKGVVGELYLSGDSLANGYLKLEDLTNSKFIDNPFVEGRKMYHTGDLARINRSGEFEYLGRVDEQVKLRGYRIELTDIESNLLEYQGIEDCAVVLVENDKIIIPEELKTILEAFDNRGELLKGFDENLEIRDFVTGLRKKLILLFKEHAVVHLQIGKSYQYSEGIEENSLNLVKAIKQYTDPDNLINPGSLGL